MGGSGIAERRAQKTLEVNSRVAALQTEVTDAKEKLARLYKIVEDGDTEVDDVLRERPPALKLDRDRAQAALERIKARASFTSVIDPEAIERFGRAMRENITTGEIPFRKAYIRSVVDRIEVDDDVIRIIGNKATLEQIIAGREATPGGVRSFERNWRA